ncbi:MAG: S8 family serine peptidase [Rhodoferax sp.]|uniref:S8 family serine peptidase n=1 Tax=Rhodoferax sp. TaxID=50421 RepID=UPI00261FF843|nr:S8 family serine peptidase [Rhodoferax sp.]MDD5335979.1 S8 family serine peptidase [Rhodoferax sp.]
MMRSSRLPVPAVRQAVCWAAIAAALCCAAPAQAQLGLPRLRLPSLPVELPRLPGALAPEALPNPTSLRLTSVRQLLRDHPDLLEADPAGEPMRRQELLLVSPAAALVDAAVALGFVVLREQWLAELALRQLVLRPPPGWSTAEALERLRALEPQVEADFNHVYTRSGETSASVSAAPGSAATSRRVGLIDSGLDRQHAALRDADLRTWGCNDVAAPSPHGTAVASLLVGRDVKFAGVAAGSVLYAADIYCGQPAGGAAENIASALAWLAREQVAVVNISLVGPANRLLERAVQAMNRKGHLLVAAVGNDGPAAPPLYPAAYPGVVGVTAVTSARRVLPEAAQGPQVMFAAPGADLAVAQAGGGYSWARGTSFAAPIVAGLLAERLRAPDQAGAAAALAHLADSAIDLGAPGRDPVYGFGLVGEHALMAPRH